MKLKALLSCLITYVKSDFELSHMVDAAANLDQQPSNIWWSTLAWRNMSKINLALS
ncbi:hypothetical protein [Planococcus sp. YIM B11945]|uniref:hypothetical protein n=1 Tax=Planococcus sp. YIM B11945 TaxID=3435410 RepID=UPI003D7CB8FA